MDPQGPQHSDPIDFLMEWSVLNAMGRFTIRAEKPIRIPDNNSCPEPDLAWVTRRRYVEQHPNPQDVHLLIEVSFSSSLFDRTEKQQLYASAGIQEYWIVDPSMSTVMILSLVDSKYAAHPFAVGDIATSKVLNGISWDVLVHDEY
jgi:Uma2 family endonuclease